MCGYTYESREEDSSRAGDLDFDFDLQSLDDHDHLVL